MRTRKTSISLWVIHEEVAGQGAGRKYGIDVLNRAAIVFVTACWESFVEDTCAPMLTPSSRSAQENQAYEH